MTTDMREITVTCPKCGAVLGVRYSPYAPYKNTKCPSCSFKIPLPQGSPGASLPVPENQGITAGPAGTSRGGGLTGRLVAGVVGGLILGVLAANICTAAAGDFGGEEVGPLVMTVAGLLFFGMVAVGIATALKTGRTAKVWRRLLIPSGILSLALPFSILVGTGRAAHSSAASGSDIEAGVLAGGGTAFAIVVGFFAVILAAIFLTTGLLVGRERRSQTVTGSEAGQIGERTCAAFGGSLSRGQIARPACQAVGN